MTRVSAAEGIRYGFGLLGYSLGVTIFGFLITVVGIALLTQGSFVIGGVLVLAGGVAFYSGVAGTLYKVIADAVAKGNEMNTVATAQKVSSTSTSTPTTTAKKVESADAASASASTATPRDAETAGTKKEPVRSGETQTDAATTESASPPTATKLDDE